MGQRQRVLVVDDEPQMRSVLRRGLSAEGFGVVAAATPSEALDRLATDARISVITLDLTLGNEDGLAYAAKLRATRNVPVIMVTARASPLDRVRGLEHGADDYIIKPFHIRELTMRIRTVLSRYSATRAAAESVYIFEGGTLDTNKRELRGPEGELCALTNAEFDILKMFLAAPGRIMSRDDIALQIKGQKWSPSDRTTDVVIARLRRKLEKRLDRPTLIKTVWGVGYVFSGDVRSAS